ncbi:MAG: NADH-quinone oxidoreductase subunit N [Bacteroidetes bacterium]|nr:NADH-quinone oxidoreductase subunit N [Bacteroidota bacterium]
MLDTIILNLTSILPEVIVTATLCVVLLVHLFDRKNIQLMTMLTVAGLLAAFYVLSGTVGANSTAFSGMLSVDPFAHFFKIVIVLATIVVALMSRTSDEVNAERATIGEYYFLLLTMALGMMFMVGASNLLMMYLTLEMSSLSSYVASGFTRKAKDSSEASLKYLIYGAFSSGVMLYGISIVYGLTGTLDLNGINTVLQQGSSSPLALLVATIFILVGFGYKISAVPFHFWTPDVYEGAPTAVTAFLSVASKAAGFAMMMRAFKVMFIDPAATGLAEGSWALLSGIPLQHALMVLSVLTMTLGNLVALWQDNVKRMLAYSSIAQAGYMLLGLVVFGNDGFAAVMIYFAVYLFMNLGAFYAVMLVANTIKSEHVDHYKGLGKRAPLLAVALSVFLVSLTGLPPTAGFIGKWMIFLSLINAKMIGIAIVGVLNSVVSLYYYVRIIRNMFLREDQSGETAPLQFSIDQKMLLLFLLIPTLYFGLFFDQLVQFAQMSVQMFGMR